LGGLAASPSAFAHCSSRRGSDVGKELPNRGIFTARKDASDGSLLGAARTVKVS
jgi:hypothetical protein